ncbi:MAG: protein kinase [Gemmatimonadetes bacterium]|nr:protein kinase [Gemmatimonadota bacterium]
MSDTILERLRAALGERYTIDRQVGQGGMATVYGATDRKHNRQVAIKVLRPELAATIGGDRFLREIEVSARLQHPHIVPLYDSGDAGGVLYYVMPFVTGESLRDRLTRDGKIPFEEAVALLRQMASALAYAHQQGIIHRDIKPENVLLSNGVAVVADFGIARALRAASEGSMTGLGFAIGTPAYMSPEQATASDIDERSDQYSLACVFYEMVTGAAPFAAPTMQAVLTKSLSGPRPRLSKVARTTPAEADAPVTRALAADPKDRYATVTDFAAALERAAGGGSGAVAERTRLKRLVVGLPVAVAAIALAVFALLPRGGSVVRGAESMVVLPFNATGPGVDVLGEGMVDLLTTNLNAVGGIRAVEPRAVLARLKKEGAPADVEGALRFAGALKANSVVMGSIVATGSRVRVSADLYGPEGTSLARAQVDGAADSVLQLVDQLSLSLVREIWRSKEPVPNLRVTGLTTNSLAAMREYLTGEQFYRRAMWESAQAAFGRAIEDDTTFALAHYRLAMALGWKGGYGSLRADSASAAALRMASRLPPRERTLVAAYRLFSQGRLAASDSMRAYLREHPDDLDAWYLLGESQYHSKHLTGQGPAALREPFDRVLAADSTLTPAAIHPLETAIAQGDSIGFQRYLRLFRSGADSAAVRGYEVAGAMAFAGLVPDSATASALGNTMGAAMSIYSGAFAGPGTTGDTVLARYERLTTALRPEMTPPVRLQLAAGRGLILLGLGRFAAATAFNDTLVELSRDQAGGIRLFPHVMGYAAPGYEEAWIANFLSAPVRSPFQGTFAALILLNRGETGRAGRLLDSLQRDTTAMPPFLRGALEAAQGIRRLDEGDTTRAIRELESGIERVGNNMMFNTAARLRLGAALAARPATQEKGLGLLRNAFVGDIGLQPIAAYQLGRTAEAVGRRDLAMEGYSQFLRLWNKADPAVQPRVEEARAALARLTAEGAK